jgi:hypothetical protein
VIGNGVQSGSAPNDVDPDMGIVGATTDTFILFENGVRRNRPVLPGLSNAADHMPSKPEPPAALASSKLGTSPEAATFTEPTGRARC